MSRKTTVAAVVFAMLFPIIAFAQTAPICSLEHTLSHGMSGPEVTILQSFLKAKGYFILEPTGYFGLITEASLANWQLDVGIVTSIVDGGVYGPRTRAYVRERFCGDVVAAPVALCPAAPPLPIQPQCAGTWNKTYNAQQCHVGWTCVVAQLPATTNKSPFISAIIGPTKLKTDQSGTWKVTATDPENGSISYSVIWGDEGDLTAQLLELAGGNNFITNTSFTHAYATSGYYTIVIFAKDTANNDTKATLSVFVESPPPPPLPISPSVTSTNTTNDGRAPCTYNGQTYADGSSAPGGWCCPNGHCVACVAGICKNGQWTLGTQTQTNTGPTGGTALCTANGQIYAHEGIYCTVASCWLATRCCNGRWYAGGNIIGPGSSCAFWAAQGNPGSPSY